MNLVSRMRNAGGAFKDRTTMVLIPALKAGGGTDIGNQQTIPPAFLFSLVFRFAEHFRKSLVHTSEPKSRQLPPGGSDTLNRTSLLILKMPSQMRRHFRLDLRLKKRRRQQAAALRGREMDTRKGRPYESELKNTHRKCPYGCSAG